MPSLRAFVIAALVGLFLGGVIRSFIYEIKGNKSKMHTNGCVAAGQAQVRADDGRGGESGDRARLGWLLGR